MSGALRQLNLAGRTASAASAAARKNCYHHHHHHGCIPPVAHAAAIVSKTVAAGRCSSTRSSTASTAAATSTGATASARSTAVFEVGDDEDGDNDFNVNASIKNEHQRSSATATATAGALFEDGGFNADVKSHHHQQSTSGAFSLRKGGEGTKKKDGGRQTTCEYEWKPYGAVTDNRPLAAAGKRMAVTLARGRFQPTAGGGSTWGKTAGVMRERYSEATAAASPNLNFGFYDGGVGVAPPSLALSSAGARRSFVSKPSGSALGLGSGSGSLLSPAASRYSGMGLSSSGNGIGRSPVATRVDAVVIGAGQAGLSVGYHLQKAGGLRFVTLDANQEAGGAWRHRWPSLELFSTRKWSSLPGFPMFAHGACEDGYPSSQEMALYMEEYESVMKLNIVRPVTVTGVTRTAMGTFMVDTDCLLGGTPARWEARAVISAAGTHASPIWPRLPGAENFRGTQIHSSQYRQGEDFTGKRVAVVGSGNSGAQILAEVASAQLSEGRRGRGGGSGGGGGESSLLWSTMGDPSFLPMELTGKDIFDNVARLRQKQGFVREEDIPSLHGIIMQPGVVEALERGVYDLRVPSFTRLTPTGVAWEASPDGSLPAGSADVDVIIWCTGYRSNTSHLSRLGVVEEDSTVAMDVRGMGESETVPGVFAVGYGNWSGVGSGSIPGSTYYARRAATAAVQHVRGGNSYDFSRAAVEATMANRILPFNGSLSMGPPSSSSSSPSPPPPSFSSFFSSSLSSSSSSFSPSSAWPTSTGRCGGGRIAGVSRPEQASPRVEGGGTGGGRHEEPVAVAA